MLLFPKILLQKVVLWEKYAKVYDTLNQFYPYKKLIKRIANEICFLISQFPKTKKIKILEIGCGTGNILKQLENIENIEMLALDKYPQMIDIATKKFNKQNITFITADADQKDFAIKDNTLKKNSIDIAFLNLTLFNIENKELLFNNITTILKSSGYLLITDFKPDNTKSALIKAHIKEEGIISLLKNTTSTIKINNYTKKIFDQNKKERTFTYLSKEELINLFIENNFSIIKTESVYENQANMVIGKLKK